MKASVIWSSMVLPLAAWCSLVPKADAEGEQSTDNVVVILDCSGSMGRSMASSGVMKIQAAKNALLEVLKQVPENTRIGVLSFSARNVKDDWLYPLGPRDDQRLAAAINSPQPGNGTPLGKYIKMGADVLLRAREKQYNYGTYRLLIVTDGEAGDKELVEKHTPEVIARGIIVDVIGVDMAQDHTLATKVHSYRKADDPQSLTKALAEIFAEVSSATGTDAATEDAFATLAPIPEEMAQAMLKALTTSSNEPIGQSPRSKTAAERQHPGQSGRAPGTQSPPAQPMSGQGHSISSGSLLRTLVMVLFAVAVFFSFLNKVRRKGGQY